MDVQKAKDQAQELKQEEGSNVRVSKARIEDAGVCMEVPNTLVTLLAVLEVHELLC